MVIGRGALALALAALAGCAADASGEVPDPAHSAWIDYVGPDVVEDAYPDLVARATAEWAATYGEGCDARGVPFVVLPDADFERACELPASKTGGCTVVRSGAPRLVVLADHDPDDDSDVNGRRSVAAHEIGHVCAARSGFAGGDGHHRRPEIWGVGAFVLRLSGVRFGTGN